MTRMQFETVETIENLQLQIIDLNKKIREMGNMLESQQKEIDILRNEK
jgi:hypothetical protein